MNALEYIAEAIKSEDVIPTFDRYGELEIDYRYQDLTFYVSNQLDTDGYFAVLVHAGREWETNSPQYEHEFTGRTALATLSKIKKEADAWLNRYAD